MTELLTPSVPPPVPSAPPPEPPSRSGLVTASGIVVAIVPGALLAITVVRMPDTAPVWSARTALVLAVLALVTLSGIAIANRWRGWRVCSGTLGWILIVLSNYALGDYLQSLEGNLFLAPRGPGRGTIFIAAAAALLGVFVLVAKRDEPPPRSARPMTAIGIVSIAIGFAVFVASAIYLPISLLLALLGIGMVMHWPGWRIYTGCLAWIMIATGIVGFLGSLPRSDDPDWMSRLWWTTSAAALSIGIGYLILWSKRREPRPVPKRQDAAAVT